MINFKIQKRNLNSMKKTLRALLAFTTISFLAGAVPAFAADMDPLHVSVPFAFKAGKTVLPAGDYTVYSDDSRIIMIRGARGGAILLGSAGSALAGGKSGVSFEREGGDYILRAVQSWGKTSSTRVADVAVSEDK
jgi:hypothetical protein